MVTSALFNPDGSIKIPKKSIKIKEKAKQDERGKGAASSEESTMAISKEECPKCANIGAYWWTEQTRSSDEPETQFFRCTKCKHTWREYD
tara:strand:- start:76 stop:345 length:270 start_codon:yes stop_codon:yes gene_type:complete